MRNVLLHYGTQPTGLASIIPLFREFNNTDIYLINNENWESSDFEIYFWSTLKLQKEYDLQPELGYVFEKITIKAVIDIAHFNKIRNALDVKDTVYFSINFSEKELSQNALSLANAIECRKLANPIHPIILILINVDFSSAKFKEYISEAHNGVKNSIDPAFDSLFIIECETTVLSSFPEHTLERAILHSENIERFIYFNKIDIDAIFANEKIKSELFFKSFEQIIASKKVVVSDCFQEAKFAVYYCKLYTILLAILAYDANYVFISEYLKENKKAREIADELQYELFITTREENFIIVDFEVLKKHLSRIRKFGGNTAYLLSQNKIQDIYYFLYNSLNYNVELHNKIGLMKGCKLIPHALKLAKRLL